MGNIHQDQGTVCDHRLRPGPALYAAHRRSGPARRVKDAYGGRTRLGQARSLTRQPGPDDQRLRGLAIQTERSSTWGNMGHVFPDLPMVPINLWRADAVVLFDWLMTVDLDTVPITHPAQKQALTDLLTRLEQETDILPVTQDEIDAAQADVARDMGW